MTVPDKQTYLQTYENCESDGIFQPCEFSRATASVYINEAIHMHPRTKETCKQKTQLCVEEMMEYMKYGTFSWISHTDLSPKKYCNVTVRNHTATI